MLELNHEVNYWFLSINQCTVFWGTPLCYLGLADETLNEWGPSFGDLDNWCALNDGRYPILQTWRFVPIQSLINICYQGKKKWSQIIENIAPEEFASVREYPIHGVSSVNGLDHKNVAVKTCTLLSASAFRSQIGICKQRY